MRRVGSVLFITALLAGTTALMVTSCSSGPSGLRAPARVPAPRPGPVSSGTWDIDGVGQPAALVAILPVGNPRTTFSFLLVVRAARYGTQTVPFAATSVKDMPPDGPVIIGTADAAGDGHSELFVQVDSGCCTEFWTIFRLVDGRIRQVTVSGYPVRLGVGGTVMNNGGFSCEGPDHDVVIYGYSNQVASPANVTFLATRDTYRWAGANLVLVSREQTTIHGAQSPELGTYSRVSCGDLSAFRGEL
jgi:hypothetical protein